MDTTPARTIDFITTTIEIHSGTFSIPGKPKMNIEQYAWHLKHEL